MPVTRTQAVLEPMVLKALETHAMGEEFWYEMGLAPSPQGPGLGLALFLRGMLIGTTLQVFFTFTNPFQWSEEGVGEAVRQMIGALLDARSKQGDEGPPTIPLPGIGSDFVSPNGAHA